MTEAVLAALVILGFAAVSFFFSLAETSLFALAKWQVRELADHEPRRGKIVLRLLSEPQDLLATMSLGNTIALAAIILTGLWLAVHGSWPPAAVLTALFAL